MANPQPTDAHLRIAHRIQEEIGMREFSKRQRKILDFILRLSWGCGKKCAYIPKQKYFTLYGIPEQDIKRELKWLIAANVIEIDEEQKSYWFNKDYDSWKVSIVSGYDYEMFKEVLHLNIETSQNTKNELRETRSTDFVKHEEGHAPDEVIAMSDGAPKESIKENIYTSTTNKPGAALDSGAVQNEDVVPPEGAVPLSVEHGEAYVRVLDYFSDRSGVLFPSPADIMLSKSLAVEIAPDIIIAGIDESFKRYRPRHPSDKIRTLKYCEGTIRDLWEIHKAKGAKVDGANSSNPPGEDNKTPKFDKSRFYAKS